MGPVALGNRTYCISPRTIDDYGTLMEGYMSGENRSTRIETCSDATSSTTNPTWTSRGLNSVFYSEILVNIRVGYGTTSQGE
jgi:hypothetical protein